MCSSSTGIENNDNNLSNILTNPKFKLDGSKGPVMNFRKWNRQLRQTIMLTTENWVTSVAPLESFVHRNNNLDTIGMDSKRVLSDNLF